MRTYPFTAIEDDAWKSIEMVFWRHEIPCLPKGSSGDGFDPKRIETNKYGVEIFGNMTFLRGGGSMFAHKMALCFLRPTFNSVASIRAKKVETANLKDAYFENEVLVVSLG